jgi:hypothetical protein
MNKNNWDIYTVYTLILAIASAMLYMFVTIILNNI